VRVPVPQFLDALALKLTELHVVVDTAVEGE
jgi:hypothetical protein